MTQSITINGNGILYDEDFSRKFLPAVFGTVCSGNAPAIQSERNTLSITNISPDDHARLKGVLDLAFKSKFAGYSIDDPEAELENSETETENGTAISINQRDITSQTSFLRNVSILAARYGGEISTEPGDRNSIRIFNIPPEKQSPFMQQLEVPMTGLRTHPTVKTEDERPAAGLF